MTTVTTSSAACRGGKHEICEATRVKHFAMWRPCNCRCHTSEDEFIDSIIEDESLYVSAPDPDLVAYYENGGDDSFFWDDPRSGMQIRESAWWFPVMLLSGLLVPVGFVLVGVWIGKVIS